MWLNIEHIKYQGKLGKIIDKFQLYNLESA